MSLKERWKPQRLPEKLLYIRKALNLSQNEMLRHLGMQEEFTRKSISSYERGEAEPPLPVLLLYANAAGITTDILIDDKRDVPDRLPAKIRKT
jgi:transcriptional regulator with XRE-family HTH domain